ncbi:MAG TPA: lipoyl(octanoyl) transferase LipB [Candidatus Hydrogenedentes bacterium]|nr:lipoyl(octanoyl) transferase LipB [Candidatus Hydrogenedentota bacterium]HOK90752.1 lipoyl(octanoyl) transferase LipB [Candidatus Hydrogenedentota bacterium]
MAHLGTPSPVTFRHLGSGVPYADALRLQHDLVDAIAEGRESETVLTLEHAPVITLGRRANPAHVLLPPDILLEKGISLVHVDRGGDVTYHGPGQFVSYPLLRLDQRNLTPRGYLRFLEDAVIRLLAALDIQATRLEGYTGVWTRSGKICAIGVASRRWVSFHGIALNLTPDWTHWSYIIPCGIPDKPVTSVGKELGKRIGVAEILPLWREAFLEIFP